MDAEANPNPTFFPPVHLCLAFLLVQRDKDLQGVHVGFDSYTFRPVGRHPAMVIFAVACGRVADLAAPHPGHNMVGRPSSVCRFPVRSHIPSFSSLPSIQLCDDLLLRNQPICTNLFRTELFSSNASSSPEAIFGLGLRRCSDRWAGPCHARTPLSCCLHGIVLPEPASTYLKHLAFLRFVWQNPKRFRISGSPDSLWHNSPRHPASRFYDI